MAKYRLIVSVSALLGFALVAACDKKSEGDAPATTATTTASAAPAVSTTPAASATVSAPAMASASASASADAAAGDVKVHLDKIKVSSGKIDGVDRHMKSQNNSIKRKCVDPAVKKDPTIDGELKDVVELDGDGKVTKQTTTVTGKLPDDLVACVKKVVEKVEFDTDNGKAKAEMNYKIGPHAEDAPDKK